MWFVFETHLFLPSIDICYSRFGDRMGMGSQHSPNVGYSMILVVRVPAFLLVSAGSIWFWQILHKYIRVKSHTGPL